MSIWDIINFTSLAEHGVGISNLFGFKFLIPLVLDIALSSFMCKKVFVCHLAGRIEI